MAFGGLKMASNGHEWGVPITVSGLVSARNWVSAAKKHFFL
jgi:hypothetical protein